MIPSDAEDRDRALFIVGECSSLSEAQWREIKETLAKRGINLDPETFSKLVEIPAVFIVELHDAIEAKRAQPTRAEMAKRFAAVRESRQFDDTDPNMLERFERKFSDRKHRTKERTRKLADKAVRGLRQQGKGNKSYYPQPDGIDPPTKCALIISVKLNWPAARNRQAQAACEALYAAAGGDIKRPGSTPNSSATDGTWRDHLREAQRLGPEHVYSRVIASYL